MSIYQLQIKQVVDYPRCRIYREFIHKLIDDRSIRTSGGSGLFHFTVLCSYVNFRTSYRRIDGISYTVYPGEWICTVAELSSWFRTRFHRQALSILDTLQKQHFLHCSASVPAFTKPFFLYPQSQYGPPEARVCCRTKSVTPPASLMV